MNGITRQWLNNSAANLVGGLSGALFNLLIPAIVSRHLPSEQFSAWSLVLQVVAYVNLLGLGLQTATAREIARAHEHGDEGAMRRIVRAAGSIAQFATGCALVAVLALVLAYPLLFPGIPASLLPTFRAALLMIGASTAIQLLALVPMAVFQGVHRNIVFVVTQVAIRVAAVILVWFGARIDLQLLGLSAIVALCMAALYPAMSSLLRKLLPWSLNLGQAGVDRMLRRELLNYCATLSVWNLSMLLVNSVGIVMVGRVAFDMSGAYAIAMSATTILAGLIGAVFSPLLTSAAAMHASPARRSALPSLLTKSTLACAIGLHLLFVATLLLHKDLIRLWVGSAFVTSVSLPLLILIGAHALRNLVSPYAIMLLATGLHRRALLTSVAEGLVNLVATIVLGHHFGVVGIACGTLAGSIATLLFVLALNTRSTPELTPRPLAFVAKGFVLPGLAAMPVYLLVLPLIQI